MGFVVRKNEKPALWLVFVLEGRSVTVTQWTDRGYGSDVAVVAGDELRRA